MENIDQFSSKIVSGKNTYLSDNKRLIVKICLFSCIVLGYLLFPQVVIGEDHLRYFGYAGIDVGLDDPFDDTNKMNYVDEVASFCNVGHITANHPMNLMHDRLQVMLDANMKGILHIQNIIFSIERSYENDSGWQLAMYDNAQDRWNQFVERNRSCLTENYIACFYLVDEPVWNGLSYVELEDAAEMIKATFPDIPIMVVEAYPTLEFFRIPDAIDWVGFDYYGTLDPSEDADYLRGMDYIKWLRTRSSQKIMLIMEGQWFPEYSELGYQEEVMADIALNYMKLALSREEIIGIIGYTWPGGIDGNNHKGVRDMHRSVRDMHKRIGEYILTH